MLQALLPILGSIGGQIAKNLFPDPAEESKRQAVELQFQAEIMKQAQAIEVAAAEIVKAEAASGHWLAANWRPLTMLVFVGLIVARWFGWAAPNLSEDEYLKLWSIVEFGLGGYVVGRSVEKVAPAIADALRKR